MFDEATLEKITMELLTNLGYETLNGYELERENYSNVILDDDLENAIIKLNKNITNDDHYNYSMSVFDEKEESTGQEENESNTTYYIFCHNNFIFCPKKYNDKYNKHYFRLCRG